MRSMVDVHLGYGFIYEQVFTDREHYAAIKETYNIIYDGDTEEAIQQFNVRMYYCDGFNCFYIPEDYIEEHGAYGTMWWEK